MVNFVVVIYVVVVVVFVVAVVVVVVVAVVVVINAGAWGGWSPGRDGTERWTDGFLFFVSFFLCEDASKKHFSSFRTDSSSSGVF